ncbi:MAG TPA: transposase [Roseimicrobium sp.]|nr:transposase [Roseimicrobium sp.]
MSVFNGRRVGVTWGTHRNAELFVAHLDDLRRTFRPYRVMHVICDNASFHTIKGSKVVREYLAWWGERIVLHYLPAYSPKDASRAAVERVLRIALHSRIAPLTTIMARRQCDHRQFATFGNLSW